MFLREFSNSSQEQLTDFNLKRLEKLLKNETGVGRERWKYSVAWNKTPLFAAMVFCDPGAPLQFVCDPGPLS